MLSKPIHTFELTPKLCLYDSVRVVEQLVTQVENKHFIHIHFGNNQILSGITGGINIIIHI